MNKNKHVSSLVNYRYSVRIWQIVAGVVMASNIILSYFVLTANTTEKTIIVPPQLDAPFTVYGDEVSSSYIEQMSVYFVQLLLTYNKKNARTQFDMVLHYVNPSAYGEMNTKFSIDIDRITRNDISSAFYPLGIHIKKNVAYVSGELRGYVGSKLVSKREKTFELSFTYEGKLTITGFKEVRQNRSNGNAYEEVTNDAEMIIEGGVGRGQEATPEEKKE